jgi:hypothetical protein
MTLGILVLASACASPALAQRGIGGANHFVRAHRAGRSYARSVFWPGYYSDYEEPAAIEALQPQIIQFVQSAPPAAQPRSPAESLILELQGDHWVRITNGDQSQSVYRTASTPEPASPIAGRTETGAPALRLPPAVLVFRDGHQEEIAKYTIVGSTLVANADYWTTGAWTRKIQIADLDVPETLRLNQKRGAQFKLPSGPNEVIVRP